MWGAPEHRMQKRDSPMRMMDAALWKGQGITDPGGPRGGTDLEEVKGMQTQGKVMGRRTGGK